MILIIYASLNLLQWTLLVSIEILPNSLFLSWEKVRIYFPLTRNTTSRWITPKSSYSNLILRKLIITKNHFRSKIRDNTSTIVLAMSTVILISSIKSNPGTLRYRQLSRKPMKIVRLQNNHLKWSKITHKIRLFSSKIGLLSHCDSVLWVILRFRIKKKVIRNLDILIYFRFFCRTLRDWRRSRVDINWKMGQS